MKLKNLPIVAAFVLSTPLAVHSQDEPVMPWIAVSSERTGFSLLPSGRPFTPFGFNYHHDEQGRLLEDYWEAEWNKVEQDFAELKILGV